MVVDGFRSFLLLVLTCFRDGSVWMVGYTIDQKLAFSNSVFEKHCFRDGSWWMVGYTS